MFFKRFVVYIGGCRDSCEVKKEIWFIMFFFELSLDLSNNNINSSLFFLYY